MRKTSLLLSSMIAITVLFACKSDLKEAAETTAEQVVDSVQPEKPKGPTKETIAQSNSVMARIMTTSECSSLSRYLVTADLANTLLMSEGPFTVFAPENAAFEALDENFVKELPSQQNRQALIDLLKLHVVEGTHDSASLVQALKLGKVNLTTLAGEQLSISMQGTNIVVRDPAGNKGVVGKSDIQGSNGVVHVLDKVLGVD